MPETKLKIGILGAGPAGLAAALALESYTSHSQVEITILDKNSSVSDYEGVEYGIQEPACRALDRIGIKNEVMKRSNPVTTVRFFNERKEKTQFSLALDPEFNRQVYRKEFLEDMEVTLKRTMVLRNCFVVGFEVGELGNVSVATRDGGLFTFDCVIAAEGINSPTRRQLYPEDSVIVEHDFAILYLLVEGKPGQEMPANFFDVANGPMLQFSMGDYSTNSFFPLNNGRLSVAISFDHNTRRRIWKECGIDETTPWGDIDGETRLKIAKSLSGDSKVYDGLFPKMLEYVPDWNSKGIYLWTMRDTSPLKTPYANNGNVVLIGDAAHAMLPCLGLGATIAIEDAEILARLIADHIKSNPNPPLNYATFKKDVLVPFTKQRYPRWEDLLWRSRHASRNFMGQGKKSGFTLAPFIPIRIIANIVLVQEWIYNSFFAKQN